GTDIEDEVVTEIGKRAPLNTLMKDIPMQEKKALKVYGEVLGQLLSNSPFSLPGVDLKSDIPTLFWDEEKTIPSKKEGQDPKVITIKHWFTDDKKDFEFRKESFDDSLLLFNEYQSRLFSKQEGDWFNFAIGIFSGMSSEKDITDPVLKKFYEKIKNQKGITTNEFIKFFKINKVSIPAKILKEIKQTSFIESERLRTFYNTSFYDSSRGLSNEELVKLGGSLFFPGGHTDSFKNSYPSLFSLFMSRVFWALPDLTKLLKLLRGTLIEREETGYKYKPLPLNVYYVGGPPFTNSHRGQTERMGKEFSLVFTLEDFGIAPNLFQEIKSRSGSHLSHFENKKDISGTPIGWIRVEPCKIFYPGKDEKYIWRVVETQSDVFEVLNSNLERCSDKLRDHRINYVLGAILGEIKTTEPILEEFKKKIKNGEVPLTDFIKVIDSLKVRLPKKLQEKIHTLKIQQKDTFAKMSTDVLKSFYQSSYVLNNSSRDGYATEKKNYQELINLIGDWTIFGYRLIIKSAISMGVDEFWIPTALEVNANWHSDSATSPESWEALYDNRGELFGGILTETGEITGIDGTHVGSGSRAKPFTKHYVIDLKNRERIPKELIASFRKAEIAEWQIPFLKDRIKEYVTLSKNDPNYPNLSDSAYATERFWKFVFNTPSLYDITEEGKALKQLNIEEAEKLRSRISSELGIRINERDSVMDIPNIGTFSDEWYADSLAKWLSYSNEKTEEGIKKEISNWLNSEIGKQIKDNLFIQKNIIALVGPIIQKKIKASFVLLSKRVIVGQLELLITNIKQYIEKMKGDENYPRLSDSSYASEYFWGWFSREKVSDEEAINLKKGIEESLGIRIKEQSHVVTVSGVGTFSDEWYANSLYKWLNGSGIDLQFPLQFDLDSEYTKWLNSNHGKQIIENELMQSYVVSILN
ncbi:MAG: hypothetical protein WC942_11750, partial [Clostridia bacterium]